MVNVHAVLARVVVKDLEAAIALYRSISGVDQVQRFGFAGVQLASVGPFLLLAGPDVARFADRVATLLVNDMELVVDAITRVGGELLEGPAPGPNGDRLIARHPDGAVFEYICRQEPQ
jgi:predicted enzyme related to lactoylglutathione lyase